MPAVSLYSCSTVYSIIPTTGKEHVEEKNSVVVCNGRIRLKGMNNRHFVTQCYEPDPSVTDNEIINLLHFLFQQC